MLNFAQPWILWGLFALLIPVLIHLINRWRHKSRPWAAMEFLLQATREMRGRKQVRHYLILTARSLAVAALVLAIARPRTSAWLGAGGGRADNVIVIFDRSSSMELRPEGEKNTLRQVALAQLGDAMKQMGSTRFFLLESAQGSLIEVSAPDVLPSLSETAATDTAANIPSLVEKAAQILDDNLPGKSELWIVSDMQSSNWSPDSGRWTLVEGALAALPEKPFVRVLAVKEKAALNRSVRVVSARVKDGELFLVLEINQEGEALSNESTGIPLTISLNGGQITEMIYPRGSTLRLEKSVRLPEDASKGFGFVSLPHDSNERDDVSFFTFSENGPARVLVFASRGESADVLGRMAAPSGLESRQLESLDPVKLPRVDMSPVALVIWEGDLPKGEEAARLTRFVEEGGILLCLPGEKKADGTKLQGELAGLAWGDVQESAEDKLFLMKKWVEDQGPLRTGVDGRSIPVNHSRALIRAGIRGAGLALVSWDDDTPAVVRKMLGKGQVFFMGTRPVYEWSNLADGYMLLPLLQRLTDEGAERFTKPSSLELGKATPAWPSSRTPVRADDYNSQAGSPQRAYEAGVYRVDNEYAALNRPAEEDVIEELEESRWNELMGNVDHSLFENSDSKKASLVSEIWRMFYIFMLAMLLVEAILSLPAALRKKKEGQAS